LEVEAGITETKYLSKIGTEEIKSVERDKM
jgi:hypothetical protein